MSTSEHPIAQVPGVGPDQIRVALNLPVETRWYQDMVRLTPTITTRNAVYQVAGDLAEWAVFDAVWMLLAARGAQAGFGIALTGKGLPLVPAMMEVHHQRFGTTRDDHRLLDAFLRDVQRGRRKQVLPHIRKRLIEARKLSSRSRSTPVLVSAERLVRDTYAALTPTVSRAFAEFMLTEYYRDHEYYRGQVRGQYNQGKADHLEALEAENA